MVDERTKVGRLFQSLGAETEYTQSAVDRHALEFVGVTQNLFVSADLKPGLFCEILVTRLLK